MTRTFRLLSTAGALLAAAIITTTASADGRHWNDGGVINVAYIRTLDGHFDDYMAWLATTWKRQQETAKKAGLITDYHVFVVEARSPNDPNVILVTDYKNWAALDQLGGKMESVSTQVEGSVEKANQSEAARAKIRTVLGSETMQEALLK